MKLIARTIKFGVYLFMGILFIGITAFFVVPPAFGTGPFMIKIVQSGSMEPAIATGAVVLIKTGTTYDIGDVVTFKSNGSETPTTHRVVGYEDVDGRQYLVTKGDANEERDAELVAPNAVIGTVYFSAPRIGFILDFARQPVGFALLIGLPAALIILDELEKIYRALRRNSPEASRAVTTAASQPIASVRRRTIVVGTSSRAQQTLEVLPYQNVLKTVSRPRVDYIRQRQSLVGISTLVAILTVIGMNTGSTISYLQDIEISVDNLFIAEEVDFSLNANEQNFIVETDAVVPHQSSLTIAAVSDASLQYTVNTFMTGGDPAFCAEIMVTSENELVYAGQILSFKTIEPQAINTPLTLSFDFANGASISDGAVCLAEVTITGYHLDSLQVPLAYHDTETISLTFVYDDGVIKVPASPVNTLSVLQPIPELELAPSDMESLGAELPIESENTESQEPEAVTEQNLAPETQNEPAPPTESE